ncbi:MAG: hypothetical protein U5L96_05135 [Owenweeksia sp.]|nr:hypothetical protein [Owenweeksia sp.]
MKAFARFRYEFADNSVFHLNTVSAQQYIIRLLKEVGFQRITTYGDFKESSKHDNPDFYIHIAEKNYIED